MNFKFLLNTFQQKLQNLVNKQIIEGSNLN